MKKILSLILLAALILTGCGSDTGAETSNSSEGVAADSSISAEGTTADFDVVDADTAQEFVLQMGQGWNLGNSLDPSNCTWVTGHLAYETAWGNPKITKELISFIKSEGFDTIRIPVTWHNHVSAAPDYTIDEQWMARVQEVVDWCVEEDLFIILNMHHEGDWLTKASTDYDNVMTQYKAIWSQIADLFGDYNEKLIFESMNEIGFDDIGNEKGTELISKINGEFTDLIRNSGKNNTERYLLLAGYWTDIDRTCTDYYTLPDDDRIMVSVHYYSPSTFAIADKTSTWGYRETWGTEEDLTYLNGQFEKLKTHFIDKGVPIIVGEYGAAVKDKDVASRILWFEKVTETCLEYDCCPVMWDNGEVINRIALNWKTDGLKEAILNAEK
ncbi:MAG: glycoside hydrolase family 5 protein [Lachnospiraceae bacterium]|nr:glycoside hydrolase family 5 protein [Lachnospiraceae bacterium]